MRVICFVHSTNSSVNFSVNTPDTWSARFSHKINHHIVDHSIQSQIPQHGNRKPQRPSDWLEERERSGRDRTISEDPVQGLNWKVRGLSVQIRKPRIEPGKRRNEGCILLNVQPQNEGDITYTFKYCLEAADNAYCSSSAQVLTAHSFWA